MTSDHSSQGPADSHLTPAPSGSTKLETPEEFGSAFVDLLYKMCKVGSIFGIDHEQTDEAVDEFMTLYRRILSGTAEEAISFQIRGEFAIVDDTQLQLSFQSQKRLRELRDIFEAVRLQGLTFHRGLEKTYLDEFLQALHRVTESENEDETLEGLDLPRIELEHGEPTRPISEALGDVTREMYVSHLYVRWLVKVRHAHRQLEEGDAEVSPTGLTRIMQNVAKQFRENSFAILSLPPLEILSPGLATHSVHASLYSMMLCDRLGIPVRMTSYLGTAVIAQDFDRLRNVSVRPQKRGDFPLETLFSTNRRDLATILERLDGRPPSALRALLTYERALSWDEAVDTPFYRRERDVHVANRLVDVARQYDLLSQGLKGRQKRSPKRALDILRRKAGEDFDPAIVELLVATMGTYPVGTTAELNTGEQVVVVHPPAPSEDPSRPKVRLIEREGKPTVDLSDDRYDQVELTETVEPDDRKAESDDVFILT